jgi:hypothetical protein
LGGKKAIVFIVQGSITIAGVTYTGPLVGWTVESEPKIVQDENAIVVVIK